MEIGEDIAPASASQPPPAVPATINENAAIDEDIPESASPAPGAAGTGYKPPVVPSQPAEHNEYDDDFKEEIAPSTDNASSDANKNSAASSSTNKSSATPVPKVPGAEESGEIAEDL